MKTREKNMIIDLNDNHAFVRLLSAQLINEFIHLFIDIIITCFQCETSQKMHRVVSIRRDNETPWSKHDECAWMMLLLPLGFQLIHSKPVITTIE